MVISTAIVVICALTIEPLAWSGRGLVVALLLVVNSLLHFTRHLPDSLVPTSYRIGLLIAGTIAATAILALATEGPSYLFGFFVAGHAGYRLKTEWSVAIATALSALSATVLWLHLGPGYQHVPWPVGAGAGMSVLLGMANRSNLAAFNSAIIAAQSLQRATEAEAREAVLTERSRIARDVHDVLAHSLAGINMQLELADALLDQGDLERVREATTRAQSLVRAGLLEAQRTVHALREEALPLVETLQAMLDSSGHPDHLVVHGTARELATRFSQALIRLTQEALTNVARHAPGAGVRVVLGYEPTAVTLEVANSAAASDRRGSGPGSGLGLVGMRERVALLGGTVTVGPVTDGEFRGGWRVWATIPV